MSIYLPLAVKNCAITLEGILETMDGAAYKLLYYDRIASLYRQVGIGEFLMTNDPLPMFKHLQSGIQAYIEFLEHAEEPEKATSKLEVLFDAVCIGDMDAVKRLAHLAPRQVNPRKEYEEDFLYTRILLDVFGLDKTQDDVQPMMDEFEAFHADNTDDRFDLVTALLEKSEPLFQETLEVLIDERVEHYKGDFDLYSGKQEEAAIMSHVSTEVIAWLKLAQRQGIALHGEYAMAPSSAIATVALPPLAPRSWRAIDSYRSLNFKR